MDELGFPVGIAIANRGSACLEVFKVMRREREYYAFWNVNEALRKAPFCMEVPALYYVRFVDRTIIKIEIPMENNPKTEAPKVLVI